MFIISCSSIRRNEKDKFLQQSRIFIPLIYIINCQNDITQDLEQITLIHGKLSFSRSINFYVEIVI